MNAKKMAVRVWGFLEPARGFVATSVQEWMDDKALRHAAALAYYTVFSMAPLLVITIAGAGFLLGEQAVEGQLVATLQDFIGREGAQFVESMVREARETGTGLGATLLSLGTMFFGALVIFSALQDVLNLIWGVEPDEESGVVYTLKRRLVAFTMILFFGLAILGVLIGSAALRVAENYWVDWFGTEWEVWAWSDQVVWLVFFTVVFGLVYKLLPDVEMAWRDVWVGAALTSILFSVGMYGVSTYVAYSGVGTIFGAAGTLAVILVWVYYSWTIMLMGAEMTQVWARRFGKGIRPGKHAVLRVDRTRTVSSGLRKGEIEPEEEEELDSDGDGD